MWCSTCRQDVPAIGSSEVGQRCLRCGTDVAGGEKSIATAPVPFEDGAFDRLLKNCPIDLEDSELDADLRAADRMVRSVQGRALRIDLPEVSVPLPSPVRRERVAAPEDCDAESMTPAFRSPRAKSRRDKTPPAAAETPAQRSNSLAWGILALSLASFVCGGILLLWSYLGQRPELWNIGIPFALVGQAGLIVGLILQLDGLWQSNDATSATLDELDENVSELRHATTLLTSSHSGPSQAFYNHFAEGAKPDLLLADLKGQLDLLATRLATKS